MSAVSPSNEGGVLVLTIDVPGEKVNVLGRAMAEEFGSVLAEIERRNDVSAVVLISGKTDSFIAGADIRELARIESAAQGEVLSHESQALLDRLAGLRIPTVAAIHGACLGGGLEVALACTYRIATDDARTALGLPEVMLGLIPGAGGTQRLPRLVGLARSLDLILTGRTLKASRALKAGLVDDVVPVAILRTAALGVAAGLASGTLRPRRRGMALHERLLHRAIARKASAAVVEKSGGHYPAPLRAIEAVDCGVASSMAEGLRREARAFGELVVSDVSRALVSVFQATQELKKETVADGVPVVVGKLGVIGAGLMGAGIAGSAAEVGVDVRLKDTSAAALGAGLRGIRQGLEERTKRRSLTPREAQRRFDRVSTTTDLSGFKRCDLVIEAVFEDLDLKKRLFAEIESVVAETCVIASNTSALPIAEIAQDAARPGRILGMHFFSPVHKMPLVEIVRPPAAEPSSLATAVAFARRLGKHVIVVGDGPGFYTTRTLAPYLNEAARLIEEGAAIEAVDEAMIAYGFPVGPMALLDEVGIDVGAKVAHVLSARLGPRFEAPASMERVLADGRAGRKSKRGFYVYDGRKRPDPAIYALVGLGARRRPMEPAAIQERLTFAFAGEAVRCLQDGVLKSPRDGDIGSVFGLGYPPFRGGVFRALDAMGAGSAVKAMERLASRHGSRFDPPEMLRAAARSGTAFHAPV